MTQDELKVAVATAALDYLEESMILGVGTGSTVNCFIDALASKSHLVEAAVASSIETANRLKAIGIPVVDLNAVGELSLYIDGADAFNAHRQLVKGGGGALTREKIITAASQKFVCIVDETKRAPYLGQFPVPIEVIPMARSYVAREIVKLKGKPVYREGFTTDNGNIILDVHDWKIEQPMELERALNHITGVVCNGLFAIKPADLILMSTAEGIETL